MHVWSAKKNMCYNNGTNEKPMNPLAAFVSLLALSTGNPRTPVKGQAHAIQGKNSRSRLLECKTEGDCPYGSTCVKLFGSYSVCIVQNTDE